MKNFWSEVTWGSISSTYWSLSSCLSLSTTRMSCSGPTCSVSLPALLYAHRSPPKEWGSGTEWETVIDTDQQLLTIWQMHRKLQVITCKLFPISSSTKEKYQDVNEKHVSVSLNIFYFKIYANVHYNHAFPQSDIGLVASDRVQSPKPRRWLLTLYQCFWAW